MNLSLQCSCGNLAGCVTTTQTYNRCRCYCKACQAFAHYLGKLEEVLDAQGGTALVQTVPGAIRIVRGEDRLACMSLKPGGLLRWYAACCKTPIGNTPSGYKMAFVGLIQTCLSPQHGADIDESLGPIQCRVNTQSARGEPKPQAAGALRSMLAFTPALVKARLTGAYKNTPFFRTDGSPISVPTVLEEAVYEELLRSI